jgi:uncharacterized membrane protein
LKGAITVANVQQSILINLPVEDVFAFVENPSNLPDVWPSLERIIDVERQPNGWYSASYVYRIAGMSFEGHTNLVEYVPNQRIVTRSKAGVEGTLGWVFQPEGSGTHLTIEAEYNVPVPLVGMIAEALLVRMHAREAKTLLANIKAKLEA